MAPRSAKQKGTEAETAVARYLAFWWPAVTRLAPAGAADKGDLDGVPELCIQVKSQRQMSLAGWVDQAREQAARAGKPFSVVIHKRVRKGDPGEWYATLRLRDFAQAYAERPSEA